MQMNATDSQIDAIAYFFIICESVANRHHLNEKTFN